MPLRRGKKRQEAEPNVGPFSDIAFLLIIYFILTTTLSAMMGNKLDIPAARENPKKSKTDQPTIVLSPEKLAWGKQQERHAEAVAGEADESRSYAQANRQADSRARIAPPKTPYQKYYEVVMAIEEAGGVLGMITEPGETASED